MIRKATEKDFKAGTTIIDSDGNKFTLRQKYDDGIWECNHRVHFEDEAKHYFVKK